MDFIIQNALQTASGLNTEELQIGHANIKVFGCGGGGSNIVNWLYKKGVKGAEIIAANTDKCTGRFLDAGDRRWLWRTGPKHCS